MPVVEEPEPTPEPEPVVEEEEPVVEEIAAVEEPALEEEIDTDNEDSIKPDEEVVNAPPVPTLPPTFVFKKPDGTIPPRKNQPVAVVEYSDPADLFLRIEPTMRKISMGKKGNMGVNFSNDMNFPDDWEAKAKSDAATLAKEAGGQSRKLRKLEGLRGIELYIKRPGKNNKEKIDANSIIIASLNNSKKAELKIEFARPDLVSLSDQTQTDDIIMEFSKDFIINDKEGNSLVFDGGENTDKSINFGIGLQTQVVENSAQQQNLESASSTAQNASTIVMVLQFLLAYMIGTGLAAFWGLINS